METFNLSNFKGGWFVGNFLPTLIPTENFEVAIKHYKAGDYEQSHFHKIATEITVIVKGKASMNGEIKNEGDVILIKKGESTDFIPLTDTITCVIKTPSIAGDKFQT